METGLTVIQLIQSRVAPSTIQLDQLSLPFRKIDHIHRQQQSTHTPLERLTQTSRVKTTITYNFRSPPLTLSGDPPTDSTHTAFGRRNS